MNVDYIIVGLGLAGIAFAEKLSENGKTFVVFENNSQTSSLVAGGMYNPIILKRFTPAWNGHDQLQYAMPKYEKLEQKLRVNFDVKLETKKVFNSIKDQNNWFTAIDKPNMSVYMRSKIENGEIDGVFCNHGFGTLKGTGRLKTEELINAYKDYLRKEERLIEKDFIYDDLNISATISYNNLIAGNVVFCEGFGLKKNPFFNYLPLNGTKGETLTIHAPELNIDFVLKSSVFVMPLGDHNYKVGATFNWTDKTSLSTEEGKKELVEKLNKVISVPYKILKQSAGIRPTVKDRRPLVGKHPKHDNLAILNGLGTRGVMIAPTIANSLFNYLEKGIPLEKEISIARFS
ncbi:Glycine/D-amino acid oxidase [Tenacibaculum sp. MAR_2009_124]|uniref:NAD(P)/FAD-dependent oxidoreductase n=1 Tax=Tenacibaculum sp. MAR_2009_124 TaxID=1250059 RepID=UPI000895BC3B|nr:FAD-binding oxidoreductase [Tenacibaculum sp. MAR_2009_124]SED07350.1 Glycine/D-amino acid oxidase [Tenacibaculum sp. MAR_2009_124]